MRDGLHHIAHRVYRHAGIYCWSLMLIYFICIGSRAQVVNGVRGSVVWYAGGITYN